MIRAILPLAIVVTCSQATYSQDRRVASGERQIEQLVDDRPSMRGLIPAGHPIQQWVIKKFERGAVGNRIYWDKHEPIHGAEHVYSARSVVRITRDKNVSGRDKWAMLVFELINFERAGLDSALRRKAVRNEIGRTEFTMECMRLEVDALRESQQFFAKHPMPGAVRSVDTFYFALLRTNTEFSSYLRFLASLDAGEYNPLEYFGMVYDELSGATGSPGG